MLFNSYEFFVFLAAVFGVFLLVRKHVTARNVFLLVASYFFYGWWDWRFLSLIAISTIVDYAVGLAFTRQQVGEPIKGRREKLLLAVSMVTNLGILATFKYAGFFAESLKVALEQIGVEASWTTLNIVLPVGISFYTFQTMSYTIDLYRGKFATERNLLAFATYVAFFPQLVAGPIERAAHLLPQFKRVLPISAGMFRLGAYLILFGLFKKIVIADNAARIVEDVFGATRTNNWEAIIAIYAFAIQIYCDFSGYSDIARGLGKIMGFDIMINFAMPYVATNPSDFWQRWHISLSSWLRDYLYISLGGNRHGSARTYANLMATMTLGGLWHGASWTFVAWGIYHGLLLIIHRLLSVPLAFIAKLTGGKLAPLWLITRIVIFFHLVCAGWVFFRANTFSQAKDILTQSGQLLMFWSTDYAAMPLPFTAPSNRDLLPVFLATAGAVLIAHVVGAIAGPYWPLRWKAPFRALWYIALVLSILFFANRGGVQFIYFEF